jgi:magnesium-transporting ATPase (P-type)
MPAGNVAIVVLLVFAALTVAVIAGVVIMRRMSTAEANRVAASATANSVEHWHALDSIQVMARLQASQNGLTDDEVKHRLARHGPNRLPEPKTRSPLMRFLSQFRNVLIYVLLVASGVTAMLGHWVDAGVILGVVLINAVIGFVQEGKAENALRAIRRMLSPQAMVLRTGQRVTVPAEQLVPGDVVLLQSGDKVPADLRLIRVKSLQVQEAVLTGESVAVEKQVKAVAGDALLGDRLSMAFSGTLVTYGQGTGVVVATGVHSEIGRISALLARVETLTTPLLRQMAQFARWLTGAIMAIAAATFAFGVLARDYSAAEMFLAAVGLAVAAIPEGLPAIMTITLAIGVQRMARRNAIIRRLPAVETLGSVTVICSDKTGTLTRNEMTVKSVATRTGLFEVSGVGYDPHGGFQLDGSEIQLSDYPILSELTRAALLCNDAALHEHEGEWVLHGDPTEGALLTLGLKAGLDTAFEQEAWPRTDVIPFESQHRFMASLHHDHAGHGFAYIKGAPERLLEMCTLQRSGGEDVPFDLQYWLQQMDVMARRGQRILAIASKAAAATYRDLTFADLETGLTLLGIVGIIDPPREDAIRAVSRCRSAGIRVKMITGDHAVTAVAIGAQMGIGDGETVLTGHEIEALDDTRLREVVDRIDIFARSSPEHKLRLVRALQANGHVVAMTGDGVNDAPALKRADVGTAMGEQGTEVAKEAAEMVLADDNFASIAHAVEEGRTVYDNLKKAILFILPTNGGEALTIIAAIAVGRSLPITPVQILWVNMITAVTLALALAFEPPEEGVMQRPPRNPREPLLSRMFIWRIVFVSLILVAGTFGLFIWERNQGANIELARTVAVNTLVMFEIFYLFNSRYISAPVLNRAGLFGNHYALLAVVLLLIFQMCFTYLGPMQTLFGTAAIDATTWLRIVLVASSVLILVELEKYIIQSARSSWD